MRVALVHDWLTGMRGGERCLEVLCELFPEADLFTLLHVPGSVSPAIEARRIRTSFVQRLPFARRAYRYYLPWMPAAVEAFDLRGYDLVLSSSHCVAKGVIAPPEARHVAYVHTPMRYAWDLRELYLAGRSRPARALASAVLARLRAWDTRSATRPDRLLANSRFVARRIERYWGREATVIPPPVGTRFFDPARVDRERSPGDPDASLSFPDRRGAPHTAEFLVVGALVPYKGVELAVRAFGELGLPLRVVGSGPLRRRLQSLAGPNVRFSGHIADDELRAAYAGCRAVVFPAIEDFGIVPLEANAMGRPVIALGQGGALETVLPAAGSGRRTAGPPPTGVLYRERSVPALIAAVRRFLRHESRFRPEALRAHAQGYDRRRFRERIAAVLAEETESGRRSARSRPAPLARRRGA